MHVLVPAFQSQAESCSQRAWPPLQSRTQLPYSLILQSALVAHESRAPQAVVQESVWLSNWHSGLRVQVPASVATTLSHLVKHVRRLSSHLQRPAGSLLHESLDGY